jgi:hypothetical protein
VSGSPALLIRATRPGNLKAGLLDANENALADAENMITLKRNRNGFIGGRQMVHLYLYLSMVRYPVEGDRRPVSKSKYCIVVAAKGGVTRLDSNQIDLKYAEVTSFGMDDF